MKDIAIQDSLKSLTPVTSEVKQPQDISGDNFFETLKGTIGEVNKLHEQADQAVQDLSTGKEKDIHNTMIALEKAEISFQMMMQVRNKIVDAYQTIMRMSV